jgi:hypothetical protein
MGWHTPCFMDNYKTTVTYAFVVLASKPKTVETEGGKMKKLAIQLFVIGTIIATSALPVLACCGVGP